MANVDIDGAPTMRQRRRKTAKERREQRLRAIARAFQLVASALDDVKRHRGGGLREIGTRWQQHVLRPHPSKVPFPNFIPWRTHCKVVLQPCIESEDAASYECSSDNVSMCDSQQLQDNNSEHCGSEGENQESEELVSRSPSESEGAHSNVALSQPSGSEASDDEAEDAENQAMVDDDPEDQRLVRKIYLPDILRPEKDSMPEEVVGCCEFCIGDLVRPRYCLAHLKTYKYGAIGQVVSVDDGSTRRKGDIIVAYFNDDGDLLMDQIEVYFRQHMEKIALRIFLMRKVCGRKTFRGAGC